MEEFVIEGGHRLKGTVVPSGNKNAAFPLIAAALLTDAAVTLSNLPDIGDVRTMLTIMEDLGVQVTRHDRHSVTLQAAGNGILTGFLLGLARASGETAPLLFTALGNERFDFVRLVRGGLAAGQSLPAILLNLVEQPVDSLPLTMWKYAQQPFAERIDQSWAVALVLMLFVLLINILVRIWSQVRTRRLQGG